MKKKVINIVQLTGVTLTLLLLLPAVSYAQFDELPCGGSDPYETDCPIDNWTWLLVVTGVLFGAYNLYRAKKGGLTITNSTYQR